MVTPKRKSRFPTELLDGLQVRVSPQENGFTSLLGNSRIQVTREVFSYS